jgi:hypothetical protein
MLAINYDNVRNGRESTRDALPLCRAWLNNCVTTHRHCNHQQERWKPTRLLKIDGDVRVALASELEGYPSYATLRVKLLLGTSQIHSINSKQSRPISSPSSF